jgi:hypothetical protein
MRAGDILSADARECLRFYCIQEAFFVRSRTLRSGSGQMISQIGDSGKYLEFVFPLMTFLCEHTAFFMGFRPSAPCRMDPARYNELRTCLNKNSQGHSIELIFSEHWQVHA